MVEDRYCFKCKKTTSWSWTYADDLNIYYCDNCKTTSGENTLLERIEKTLEQIKIEKPTKHEIKVHGVLSPQGLIRIEKILRGE